MPVKPARHCQGAGCVRRIFPPCPGEFVNPRGKREASCPRTKKATATRPRNGSTRWTRSKPSRGWSASTRCSTRSSPPPAARAPNSRSPPTRPTSTRSIPRISRPIPAIASAGNDDPPLCPLECGGDRAARQQGILRTRRPYRELPVRRDALRHRLHAFLARAATNIMAAISSISRATARPASTPAPFSRGG